MEEDESPFEEDIEALQALLRKLDARRNSLLAEVVRLRQKGPLPPLLRPGSSRAVPARVPTTPGPSAYHGGCAAEQVPLPQRPWPPACVSTLRSASIHKLNFLYTSKSVIRVCVCFQLTTMRPNIVVRIILIMFVGVGGRCS